MVNEYIRYRIGADRSDAFLRAYDDAQAPLRASEHCLGYELSRCTEAPECFVLRISWDSEKGHLEGFRGSPHFARFLETVRPFVGNIEEMRHYAPTPVRWSR